MHSTKWGSGTLHRADGEEPPPASGAPELMKETLDLLNLEVKVEPDLLHGYGEIPIVSFQEQIALGELRSGVPQHPCRHFPAITFQVRVTA